MTLERPPSTENTEVEGSLKISLNAERAIDLTVEIGRNGSRHASMLMAYGLNAARGNRDPKYLPRRKSESSPEPELTVPERIVRNERQDLGPHRVKALS